MVDQCGHYKFVPQKLTANHQKCQEAARSNLAAGKVVIIDNCNVSIERSFHSPFGSRFHTYAFRSWEVVRMRFVRGAQAMSVTSASCALRVATRSQGPSAVAGVRKMMTALELGQTASMVRSALHAWHVILSSTRTSTTMGTGATRRGDGQAEGSLLRAGNALCAALGEEVLHAPQLSGLLVPQMGALLSFGERD